MEEGPMINFRGAKMIPEWPERIRAAQADTAMWRRGGFYQRIRYGSEPDDWGADHQPCGDCGVIKGEFHVPGCDIEACPRCRGQSISCRCSDDDL